MHICVRIVVGKGVEEKSSHAYMPTYVQE